MYIEINKVLQFLASGWIQLKITYLPWPLKTFFIIVFFIIFFKKLITFFSHTLYYRKRPYTEQYKRTSTCIRLSSFKQRTTLHAHNDSTARHLCHINPITKMSFKMLVYPFFYDLLSSLLVFLSPCLSSFSGFHACQKWTEHAKRSSCSRPRRHAFVGLFVPPLARFRFSNNMS